MYRVRHYAVCCARRTVITVHNAPADRKPKRTAHESHENPVPYANGTNTYHDKGYRVE